jgi:hypothetical protein
MQSLKHMLEILKDEDFFLYVSADLKHFLDWFSFCLLQDAVDGFLQLNDFCRLIVLLYSTLFLE